MSQALVAPEPSIDASGWVRGFFVGWLQAVVPSREARRPGRTKREAILDPAKTCAPRTLLGKGTALSWVFVPYGMSILDLIGEP
jgi:hypothetical protein